MTLLLQGASRRRRFRPTYLLRDQFTTAAAAPLTSPHPSEPGPGSLVITDTGNRVSISGGALQFATGGAAGDPAVWGGAHTRKMGRTLLARLSKPATNTLGAIGWDTAQAGGISGSGMSLATTGFFQPIASGSGVATGASAYVADTAYDLAVVLRPTGAYMFRKLATANLWTLSWVAANGTTDPVYPAIQVGSGAMTVDDFRTADLSGAFATDYAIATARLAGNRALNDTFTHTADMILEATITRPSASTCRINFRVVDSNNSMFVAVLSTGAIQVSQRIAGVNTALITAGADTVPASTPTRIIVVVVGTNIYLFHGTTAAGSTSAATSFTTATNGEITVLGAGGVISNIVAWPRTLHLGAV